MNMIPKLPDTNNNANDSLGQVFKLLGHPVRLSILEHLRDGEHCVCHLEAYLGVRQASLSQQLSLLRNAGLINDRRDGWNVFYSITNEGIFDLLDTAMTFAGIHSKQIDRTGKPCPCPKCNTSKTEIPTGEK